MPLKDEDQLDAFAVAAPGIEPIVASELVALGLGARVVEGGASFRASLADVQRANLQLRAASRVVVRLGSFRATAFHELERFAGRLPWERVVGRGATLAVRASCRKSRLYHSDAVAERVLAAADRCVGGLVPANASVKAPGGEDDAPPDAQLIVVRISHDRVTVSADSSGALLHLRGYRQAVAKAPLRETLAAAMLLGSAWDPETPLLDPMCGSGTIAIEGAMISRRIPPGLGRAFGFERWPGFDPGGWAGTVEEARGAIAAGPAAPIVACDRDAGAVRAAMANAERAGVGADIEVLERPVTAAEPPGGPSGVGAIVTNPPYGVRVGERRSLRDLYAALGKVARARFPGWTIALLSADRALEAQLRLELEERFRTRNGGIPVRLVVGRIPG